MSQRKAVTRQMATRYRGASRQVKQQMLTELCELTGWHRDHARKALRAALGPKRPRRARRPRPPVYGEEIVAALRTVWAVMDAPAGKRLAPFLPEIVDRLRACGELDLDDATAARLCAMSAATIDRRLAADRKILQFKGRSGTKPGSLPKSQIPVRTWAGWDDTTPGFVEIDLVGHEGGNPRGDFCQTLNVVDIATTWTEPRAVKNKAQKWVHAALFEIVEAFPFPVAGIDSDNGAEFINDQLVRFCDDRQITFTRSRPGNKNDGCHIEEKNWSVVRQAVGYHRYDTAAELELLNQIYTLLRLQINFFSPHQKLLTKHREGAKVTKTYDTATTPYQRIMASPKVAKKTKTALTRQYRTLNPAQIRRDILDLSNRLLQLVKAKHQPTRLPVKPPSSRRASRPEATKNQKRAS
ncbi:MAG: DDE-type integrase/transposase/recombinase [Streptosporangiales bacterium]